MAADATCPRLQDLAVNNFVACNSIVTSKLTAKSIQAATGFIGELTVNHINLLTNQFALQFSVYSPQRPEYQVNATHSSLEAALLDAEAAGPTASEQIVVLLYPGTHLVGGSGSVNVPKYVNITGYGNENRIGPVIIVGSLVYDVPFPFTSGDIQAISNVSITNQLNPTEPCIAITCTDNPTARPAAGDFILGVGNVGFSGTDAIRNENSFTNYVVDCVFLTSGTSVFVQQQGSSPFAVLGFTACVNCYFIAGGTVIDGRQSNLFIIGCRFLGPGTVNADLVLNTTTFAGSLFVISGCSALFLNITLSGGSFITISDSELGSSDITLNNSTRMSDGSALNIHTVNFGEIFASNMVGVVLLPAQVLRVRLFNCSGGEIHTNTTGGGSGGRWTVSNCTLERFTFAGPTDDTNANPDLNIYADISNTKFLATSAFSQDNTIDGNYNVDLQGSYIGTSVFNASTAFANVNAKVFVRGTVATRQYGRLRMTNCFARSVWHDDVGLTNGGAPLQFWDINSSVIENPYPAFFIEFNPIRCGPNIQLRLNNNTLEKQSTYLSFMVLGSAVTITEVYRGSNHYIPTQAQIFGGNLGFTFISQATTDDNTVLGTGVSLIMTVADIQKIVVTTVAGITITLPPLGVLAATTQNSGLFVTVKNVAGAAVSVSPSGANTIDGGGLVVIGSNNALTFVVQNSTNWITVSGF